MSSAFSILPVQFHISFSPPVWIVYSRCRRWLWMTTFVIVKGLFIWNKCKIYLYLFSIARFSSFSTYYCIWNAFTPFLLQNVFFATTCNLIDSLALFLLHLFYSLCMIEIGEEFQFFFCFYSHQERNHLMPLKFLPFILYSNSVCL